MRPTYRSTSARIMLFAALVGAMTLGASTARAQETSTIVQDSTDRAATPTAVQFRVENAAACSMTVRFSQGATPLGHAVTVAARATVTVTADVAHPNDEIVVAVNPHACRDYAGSFLLGSVRVGPSDAVRVGLGDTPGFSSLMVVAAGRQ